MSSAAMSGTEKLDFIIKKLDALAAEVAALKAPKAAPSGPPGTVFPPYGRDKGQPIVGASIQSLEYYAGNCRKSLQDESKARWHDKERTLLAAIEAEIARQGGAVAPAEDMPF